MAIMSGIFISGSAGMPAISIFGMSILGSSRPRPSMPAAKGFCAQCQVESAVPRPQTRSDTDTHTQKHMHTRTRTRTHTQTHTHTHTHTHTWNSGKGIAVKSGILPRSAPTPTPDRKHMESVHAIMHASACSHWIHACLQQCMGSAQRSSSILRYKRSQTQASDSRAKSTTETKSHTHRGRRRQCRSCPPADLPPASQWSLPPAST